MGPLGWIITGVLYCTPFSYSTIYPIKSWWDTETSARAYYNILNDGKWFEHSGKKCIYKDVKIFKEGTYD